MYYIAKNKTLLLLFFPFPSVGQSENWKKGNLNMLRLGASLCSYFFIWYSVHQIKFLFLRYFLIIKLKGDLGVDS